MNAATIRLRHTRRRRLAWLLLVAGAALPVSLLVVLP
jgi:hypothetical protein